MKKKLSILLAAVLALTLVFGILPGPVAEAAPEPEPENCLSFIKKSDSDVSSGNFINGNIFVIKQGNGAVFVWIDPSIAGKQDEIDTALAEWLAYLDNSINGSALYYTSSLPSFKLLDIIPDAEQPNPTAPFEITITIDNAQKSFTVTRDGESETISHYYVFSYDCTEPEPGNLMVTKVASGTNLPENVSFSISVTFTLGQNGNIDDILTDPDIGAPVLNLDGTYTYTVSLTDNADILFSNIPSGTIYLVSEALSDDQLEAGWKEGPITYGDGGTSGSISGGDEDTVMVNNTYSQVQFGSLKVKKEVLNIHSAPSGVFPITVQFTLGSNGSLTSITNDLSLPNSPAGTYTFTLAEDASVQFNNIPVGTTYTVSEGALLPGWSHGGNLNYTWSSLFGGFWKPVNTNNISRANEEDKVVVLNLYLQPQFGELFLEKYISEGSDDYYADQTFNINVEFTNHKTVLSGITYEGDGSVSGSDGNYVVTLKVGDSGTFKNIPTGTTYIVSEPVLPEGWSMNPDTDIDYYDDDQKIEYVFGGKDTDTVDVINTFTQQYGALSVKKEVTNADISLNADKFLITVVFTKGLTGDLVGIDIGSQSAQVDSITDTATTKTFVLNLSETDGAFTFTNIPVGVTYSVTEDLTGRTFWNNVINFSDTTKTISAGDTDTVIIDNSYDPAAL